MKKVLAIIVAIVVIATLIVGIVFISNRNDDPIEPTTPNIEDATPTEPSVEPTEPEETKPDPNIWSLYTQEDPEFYDVRIDEIEKEGVEFVVQQASSPHLSIDEILYIFESNDFLKKDINLNQTHGIVERWKQNECAFYDDDGIRIYSPLLSVAYDRILSGVSQDGEAITVTCRTEDPMFTNNNIIIIECQKTPLDKYHKVLLTILSDMFGEDIATYLIYGKDKDGQYESINDNYGIKYKDEQCLTEVFSSDITKLILSRNITETGDILFKVEYAPLFSNKAFFLSECSYQTKYNNVALNLQNMFPNLSYTGDITNQTNVLPEYFAINTTKDTEKSEMQFWTWIHKPKSTNKQEWIYNFTAVESATSYPDTLNILGAVTYDKNNQVESVSLKTHAWTYVEIKDGMTQEKAIQKAIEIAQKQIKFVYDADVIINYTDSGDEPTTGKVISYTHEITDKEMQLVPQWAFNIDSGAVMLYWDITAETVQ